MKRYLILPLITLGFSAVTLSNSLGQLPTYTIKVPPTAAPPSPATNDDQGGSSVEMKGGKGKATDKGQKAGGKGEGKGQGKGRGRTTGSGKGGNER